MNAEQARAAVELLGGVNAASRILVNAKGRPIARPNLSRAITISRTPDWLSDQLKQRVFEHGKRCAVFLTEIA